MGGPPSLVKRSWSLGQRLALQVASSCGLHYCQWPCSQAPLCFDCRPWSEARLYLMAHEENESGWTCLNQSSPCPYCGWFSRHAWTTFANPLKHLLDQL